MSNENQKGTERVGKNDKKNRSEAELS